MRKEFGLELGDRIAFKWRGFTEFSTGELYEALRLRQGVFVVEQASPYPDLDGRDQSALHLLAHIDGALISYLRLIPPASASRVAIGRVAVAPAWRRHGLARSMMREALDRCRRDYSGCAVVLSAQAYLVPFYESLGFRISSAAYDDYGVPHVDMLRPPLEG